MLGFSGKGHVALSIWLIPNELHQLFDLGQVHERLQDRVESFNVENRAFDNPLPLILRQNLVQLAQVLLNLSLDRILTLLIFIVQICVGDELRGRTASAYLTL